MNEATDIEIYIADQDAKSVHAWLSGQLDAVNTQKRHKGMPKNSFPFEGEWQGHRFPGLILEKAVDRYTSLWLDSRQLPWRDDQDCGRAAAAHFNREVRICAGGWQEQDDPDAWISIDPDGNERDIQWKTD